VWGDTPDSPSRFLDPQLIQEVIATLLVTLIVEGGVVVCYALWRKRPIWSLLLTSSLANILTQSLLWIILILYYNHYLVILAITEILVWGIESLFLYVVPRNQLTLSEAALLSLVMNLSSLAFGWLLPF